MPIGVSVIIPNYNGGTKVLSCLHSIVGLNYPKFEIIVVDNNSNDGSLENIRKMFYDWTLDNMMILSNEENLGVAKATNQGIKLAKYPLILTLDLDVILHEDCLTELVKVINQDDIGAVVPKIINLTTKERQGKGNTISPIIMKTEEVYGNEDEVEDVDYVPGAVVLSKKDIALMDEDYFLYYSDAQYSKDIRDNDFKIRYVPTATAWHDCNTAEGFTPFRIQQFIRSKLLFAQKNSQYIFSFYAFFFFVYAPVHLAKYLATGKFKMFKAFCKGIMEGCK
jgi:GT2 family glycosyltransferase